MVNAQPVAVLHGIQDLEEGSLDQRIITYVSAPFGNVGEEVTFRAVLQNYKGAIRVIHNLEHRHYVGMCRSCIVERDLPGLELLLPSIQRSAIGIELVERLYSIPGLGVVVERGIHHSVGAGSQDSLQFQRFSQEDTYPRFRSGHAIGWALLAVGRRRGWRSQWSLDASILHGKRRRMKLAQRLERRKKINKSLLV